MTFKYPVFLLAGLLAVSIGCQRRNFDLTPGMALTHELSRSPESDFQQLERLFQERGGRLYDPEVETQVTWRDYRWFRVYEFSQHSVVVYPYNWTPEQYNVHLYAGQLPESRRLVNEMIAIGLGNPLGSGKMIGFPYLDLDPVGLDVARIGMDRAYLGQTGDVYINDVSLSAYNLRSSYMDEDEIHAKCYGLLNATSSLYTRYVVDSAILAVYQEAIFQDDRVAYVQYISPSSSGPSLGGLTINKPRTSVIARGVIDLSLEEPMQQNPITPE